jgi:Zn-dependent protease
VKSVSGGYIAVEGELAQLAVAVLALALVYSYPALPLYPFALLAVAAAFVPHELAHKYVAESMGLEARFRLSPSALASSIAICLLTGGVVKVGAAGAVVVSGWATVDDEGEIALAGPLANLVVATLAACLGPASPLFTYIALVNAGAAVFNLLPSPPLDGFKVLRWNREYWAAAIACSLLCSTLVAASAVQDALGWLLWRW